MTRQLPLPTLSQKQWFIFYLLAAFVLACKVMYNQHGWVNNDSLLYFEQARLLAAGQIQQAFSLYTWLFYPGLLAILHQVTGFEIHTAALCLNAVCFVLFVAGFQCLLHEAGAKMRTLHWGLLLLFSTQYIVGDVLGMLLRDEGFWAAFTWGLVYWLRSLKNKHWQDLLLFQCSMAIAVLFRIEAAAYLLALPLLLLVHHSLPWPQRLKLCLQANSLSLVIAVLVGLALITGSLHVQHLGRLQEVITQVTNLFTQRIWFINEKADIMGKQVLGNHLDDYSTFSLWASLILITAFKTLKVAGLPALLVVLWPKKTWWHKLSEHSKHLAVATLFISFIVSLVIILNVFVLSSRYVIATGIVVLMLAAFAITELQHRWPSWASRLFAGLLICLCLYSLFDKKQIDLDRQAVNYIESINPQHKPAFYDTENARFYAKQPYQDRLLGYVVFPQLVANQQIEQYDFYMITISKHEVDIAYALQAEQVMAEHGFKLVKTMYGWKKKSKVMIFSRPAR